jgi:hypothetical protein
MLNVVVEVNGNLVAEITAKNDRTGTDAAASYDVGYLQIHRGGTTSEGDIRFTGWDRSRSAFEFLREVLDEIIIAEAEKHAARDA